MGLVRYDYVPDSQSVSPFGYGLLTQVHDFNEGMINVLCIDGKGVGAMGDKPYMHYSGGSRTFHKGDC